MKGNGTLPLIKEMEKELKFGSMEVNMKDTGSEIKQMVWEG